MLFSATAALLLSSVCSATVLPREDSNSKSTESQKFITHSKPKGAEGFENSLGYLFDEYTYGAGYAVSLHTEKSDAVAGAIFNTALDFGNGDPKGFKMHDLSNKFPNSLPEIYSGQDGTPGIAVENGLLKWNSPDGVPISWFACENFPLLWGQATALLYKWDNTTTTEGCVDIDLVVEYV